MESRSNDRIAIISRVIAILFHIDEKKARSYVVKTGTGKAILNKNQIILHDQATSNIYDVISELPSRVTDNIKWSAEDIARAYSEVKSRRPKRIDRYKKKRMNARGKVLYRRRISALKRSMRADASRINSLRSDGR